MQDAEISRYKYCGHVNILHEKSQACMKFYKDCSSCPKLNKLNIFNIEKIYKICDLGISKISESSQTTNIGTPYYIAPEMIHSSHW